MVTIYPRDEDHLQVVCEDLDRELAGEPGPYILSDLRWGAGPVHVRYGGFTPRFCQDERGTRVLAIEGPDGTLVPDQRGAVFSLPTWVRPPAFLAPHFEARAATTTAELPYQIDEALHFSNGGGVYRGRDKRTDTVVVLKEARPHAGLSGDGTDAVTRLRRERDALARLEGVDAVPHLLDYLAVGEHEFLVMENVEGSPLNGELARRCPLLDTAVDESTRADYATWARSLHDDIADAVAQIHERGIVYGDLHLFNVFVRPDGRVALLDFEVAEDVASGCRPALGAVGFVAPKDRHGVDIDLYALACLQLALFVPLERLVSIDRAKAAHLAEIVAENFPVDREWLARAVRVIRGENPVDNKVDGRGDDEIGQATRRPNGRASGRARREGRRHQQDHRHWRVEPSPAGWCRVRLSLTEGILASATPAREDRLFPGDIVQFETGGGLGLAHGAAGVLHALAVTGAGRFPDHDDWLIRQVRNAPADMPLGFYDGLTGIAYVLGQLGHRAEAGRLLDRFLAAPWETLGPDLYAGLAGVGLAFAELADDSSDPMLGAAAERATQLVADGLGEIDDVPRISGGGHPFAGLLRGSAGKALLFLRMYERTGAAALLDHAATALRQDLRRCVTRTQDGQLHVDEGFRTLPYLALGSTGIGLVLRRYLAHRPDDELATAAAAIRGAACSPFYVQSGLFNGRAGMVLYLADDRERAEPEDHDRNDLDRDDLDWRLADQIHRLNWHVLPYCGHVAFPGDQLLRLSMDLATGSAGVLLALGSALHDQPVHLPFLAPPGVAPTPLTVSVDKTAGGR